jgi:hypothetical protein
MKTILVSLFSILCVWSALAADPGNPPPADKSWSLLSDNDCEPVTTPVIQTQMIYWYDAMPNGPRDRKGDLAGQEYEEGQTGPAYTEGRRLLDSDLPNPSWHTVIGWGPLEKPVKITFDLNKKFMIMRVDVQVFPSDGDRGRTPKTVPESIVYYVNATDDWKEEGGWKKAGELEIDAEDMPNWLLSKFAAETARFVRLEIAPKRGNSMYLKEVRIWGKKLATDKEERKPFKR